MKTNINIPGLIKHSSALPIIEELKYINGIEHIDYFPEFLEIIGHDYSTEDINKVIQKHGFLPIESNQLNTNFYRSQIFTFPSYLNQNSFNKICKKLK